MRSSRILCYGDAVMMKLHLTSDIDYFNFKMGLACSNFKNLLEPLPWIEPSVNMMYLEAAEDYVFGHYYSCILQTATLLEFVLRMAVIDSVNAGCDRKVTRARMNKHSGIGAILRDDAIKDQLAYLLESENNQKWWKKVAALLRNKAMHALIPELIELFGSKRYVGLYAIEDAQEDAYNPHHWGHFWHRFGEHLALTFLSEATEQLKVVLRNTLWKSDESWWESQKDYYDMFFGYRFSLEDMIDSLRKLV